MPAKPESALARPAKPESPARMATTPADAPLWPGLITSVLDPPLVSVRAAGIPWSAPSQELAESAPQLVPPSSPSSPLVPPSSPSLRVLSSLALSERPRDPAPPECPLMFAPPECPLEVVEFPKNFLGGELPAIAHWDPEPAMAHGVPWFILAAEALDLPWPPKLPASVLETICALSASCVSVSSRSQSLPGVSSAPPWWAPVSSAPPWWAPVSSAPPWWAPVSSAPPWWAPVSSAPPWWAPDLPVTSRLRWPARVTSRLRWPARVTSRLCCLICPTWTWPSVPSPGSTSAPPPSWIVLCVKRLEAALWGGGGVNLVATHYISCTTLQLHITYGLHLPSFTALTHSHPPLHQSHSCHQSLINPDCLTTPAPHSHTHTHISSTLPYKHCEVLFLPRLTFLSVIHPAICYLCVWPRTARPWISEPVPVTPTSAWYCLRLCPASDIPVFARWPLPVWFCLLNSLLHMDPHAFDQSLHYYNKFMVCRWETGL